MKSSQQRLIYLLLVAGSVVLFYWLLNGHSTGNIAAQSLQEISIWQPFTAQLTQNTHYPLAILLTQMIAIVLASRLAAAVCKSIGQPTVMGEIIAGIILGPSLLGLFFPEFFNQLFPDHSLASLGLLSQLGLIMFMFVIGMSIDINVLKNKAFDAVVISHASVVVPFALGIGLAYSLYDQFAPVGVPFISFSLFIGISMSITAFPVLARIIQERGMQHTRLGVMAITCAAADDITAWCLLAAVIAIVKAGSPLSALPMIALSVFYVAFMVLVVRKSVQRLADILMPNNRKLLMALFFVVLLFSAWAAEVIGIHALFGAFLAGAIMPNDAELKALVKERIEDVALILLLPLFFVLTGIRTEIGLINDVSLWLITSLIVLVAVTGKFLGSALAAKLVGQSWKDSLSIGALMNTRGLMELVVLNIGYDLGILSPAIFSMLVMMALITTFMTGPALNLINRVLP